MKYILMQHVEPRLASVKVDESFVTGELSGSFDFVKFKSQDPGFIQCFPAGSFNTMFLNPNSYTLRQLTVMETAQQIIRSILQDG